MAALSVAGWFVQPIVEKIINACFDYLGKQTGMEEELDRLRENHDKIQAVVLAANQLQIMSDQKPGLNTWIWRLRDALDEVNDVLDELEYMKHKEQLTKNMEETEVTGLREYQGVDQYFDSIARQNNDIVKLLGLDSYLWLLLLLDALCMLGRSFWSDNDEAKLLTPYGWP